MKSPLPTPKEGAVFYEDRQCYACLANFPVARGHVVVVWKKDVEDLHLLTKKQYEHLMDVVEDVRDAMLKVLNIKKVYLVYMDEANHVHWHLVPRYTVKGYNALLEKPGVLKDVGLAKEFAKHL